MRTSITASALILLTILFVAAGFTFSHAATSGTQCGTVESLTEIIRQSAPEQDRNKTFKVEHLTKVQALDVIVQIALMGGPQHPEPGAIKSGVAIIRPSGSVYFGTIETNPDNGADEICHALNIPPHIFRKLLGTPA